LISKNIFKFLEFVGYGVCHQRLSLSFTYLKEYMPVCSRCTGIYVGMVLSAALILLFERKIRNQLPGRKITAITVILFAAMAAESGLSSLKIIPSYNTARFLTGYALGWFLPLLILPLLNSVVFRPGICLQKQYLKKPGHFTIWIFSGTALGFIFLLTYKQIMLLWSIAAVAGLILFIAALILILVFAVNLRLRNTIQSPPMFWRFFLAAIAISLAFISLSSYLKSIVNPYVSISYEYLKSIFGRQH
jgi:uncharacterized membrane protein